MPHLMYCHEREVITGTWGGAVLTGFTIRCSGCSKVFVVTHDVIEERGSSIFSIKSVRSLTCPYCGTKDHTQPDQDYILEGRRYYDD